jgi:hypothetical protein
MSKYIYGVLIVLLVAEGILLTYKRCVINERDMTIGLLRAEKQQCDFAAMVQNERIEAYRISLTEAKQQMSRQAAQITKLANEKRVHVVETLIDNGTCEQRLKLIEEQINEYCKYNS